MTVGTVPFIKTHKPRLEAFATIWKISSSLNYGIAVHPLASSVVVAAAKGIGEPKDPNLLVENGGAINLGEEASW